MPKINMKYMPSPNREYSMSYGNLAGGLNIFELDYRLKANESPDMKNLVWKDGCLNSRNGQTWVDDTDRTVGLTAYQYLFHGAIFYHAGTSIYWVDPIKPAAPVVDDDTTAADLVAWINANVRSDFRPSDPTWSSSWTKAQLIAWIDSYLENWPPVKTLYTNVNMTSRGTFFLYDTKLYYKAPGVYVSITWTGSTYTAANVTGYVPVTYINCDPTNGAGDDYQPENRISSEKTLWYNAQSGVTQYHLPVLATNVTKVVVDGTETTAYTYYPATGIVEFNTAPPVTNPPTNNTVQITYSLANTTAMNNIMDCPYAAVYGGTGSLCIVMAGSKTQPNAYFWNGNNAAMDATYWPMTQYQLAGDSSDPITGFGKQQSYLVIFKMRTVGRTMMSSQYVTDGSTTYGGDETGRLTIDLPYIQINDKIGCDLPWTIQLIDNNLVWCNAEQGVHILKDSSSAYENNIVCISRKVNGSTTKNGLLYAVRKTSADKVSSCDDTRKYWVVVDGEVWCWDYSLSEYKDPSWFYFTNIYGRAFITDDEEVYHVDNLGRITHFKRVFADYGQPIEKVYQFSTQYFGSYDNLKNVDSIIISCRSDTNGTTRLTYITDYERREDLTTMNVRRWFLVPRNLTYRSLLGMGFAEVFRRKPMCRRVLHYAMRLENSNVGEDLSVVTAQVFYNFQGEDRGRQNKI